MSIILNTLFKLIYNIMFLGDTSNIGSLLGSETIITNPISILLFEFLMQVLGYNLETEDGNEFSSQ